MIRFPPNQTANDIEPLDGEPTPAVMDSTPPIHRYPRNALVPSDRLTYNYVAS